MTHNNKTPDAVAPRHREYAAPSAEPPQRPARQPEEVKRLAESSGDESEGGDNASAVGCNANNGNGSVRTANCNNALSNGNDNYAGAFATTNGETSYFGKNSTSRPPRSNNADILAVTDGQGQCDYGSLPYVEDENAESNATATIQGSPIFTELKRANHKRKLKGLKKFFTNPQIVGEGVDRALKRAKPTPEVSEAKKNSDAIVARIVHEMETETYRVGEIEQRDIPPKARDGKWRSADIYGVYDRCVLSVMLIVTHEKLNNLLTRNVYSGVPERALFSNNRKFCMVNKVRHYVQTHPNDYVELTDIRHFYENLNSRVALGVLFKTIVCPFTRRLFAEVLLPLDHVAIGGSLSQMVAMVTMNDLDREILHRFHPTFYGVFGDNRIIGGSRELVLAVRRFEEAYLAGRYGLPLKDDYQLHAIANGFRFCKYDYYKSSVRVRAELRRRAIRAAKRGQEHYAGYKGIFDKTDCGALQYLIENNMNEVTTRGGMAVRPMQGRQENNPEKLIGDRFIIRDYRIVPNGKDSAYYVRVQGVRVYEDAKGEKKTELVVFRSGTFEIKDFFKCVEAGTEKLPKDTSIIRSGKGIAFACHHVSDEEACDAIVADLASQGITI